MGIDQVTHLGVSVRGVGSLNLPDSTINPLYFSCLCQRSSSEFFFYLSSCDVISTLSKEATAWFTMSNS